MRIFSKLRYLFCHKRITYLFLLKGAAPKVLSERGELHPDADGDLSDVSLARRQHYRQHRRRRQPAATEGAQVRLQGL